MVQLEVLNPIGSVEMRKRTAPRLANLHGKRVGMLWNGVFRGAETFPFLQHLLTEQFPDSQFISYEEFPCLETTNLESISQAVKQKGCDAAILGNGA